MDNRSATGCGSGALTPATIRPNYQDYGCAVNAISPAALFRRYEEAGFLYPAKQEKLAPFMSAVEDSWTRTLGANQELHWIISYSDPGGNAWASISCWRSTQAGWVAQHLVSVGSPVASRAVMLATCGNRLHAGADRSWQNWFRPNNRFANRVFGSLVSTIGPQYSAVATLDYVLVPLARLSSANSAVRTVECKNAKSDELIALARAARGPVYVAGEELDADDLLLEGVDELYSRVGLRRYRRIWLAYLPGSNEPAGAAIAWRGPLGLNFSFLENRCDLLLAPGLDALQRGPVVRALVSAASEAYTRFPSDAVPVITDCLTSSHLKTMGGALVRQYSQSFWLEQRGLLGWYHHVEKFYDRMMRAEKRYGLAGRATAHGEGGSPSSAEVSKAQVALIPSAAFKGVSGFHPSNPEAGSGRATRVGGPCRSRAYPTATQSAQGWGARNRRQVLMDDPREAERLASKVDPREWVRNYLAQHVGGGVLYSSMWDAAPQLLRPKLPGACCPEPSRGSISARRRAEGSPA